MTSRSSSSAAGRPALAMGSLPRAGASRFVILERADSVAPAWRERWDSLTLFTPRRYSALPGASLPGRPGRLPDARRGDRLPRALRRDVRASDRVRQRGAPAFSARKAASSSNSTGARSRPTRSWSRPGPSRRRSCPSLRASSTPAVWQAHSTGYRRPSDVPEGTVLVVGGGNTGFQIAKELSATHKVVLSIGSKQKPLPQRIAGRDLFWWLTKTHLLSTTVESRLGKKVQRPGHADRIEPARAHAQRTASS